MSMDPMAAAAPPAAAEPEGDAADGSEAEQNYARACAALELASGSPEALAAPATRFVVELQDDDSAVVTIGDVEVAVTAEQIDAEAGEELAEIDGGAPDGMDGAA